MASLLTPNILDTTYKNEAESMTKQGYQDMFENNTLKSVFKQDSIDT